MTILVFQSVPETRDSWIESCLDSVRRWAQRQGFAYCCLGDELFENLPPRFRSKVASRTPILADLGRLQWAQRFLSGTRAGTSAGRSNAGDISTKDNSQGVTGGSGGHDTVVWVDADAYCFDVDWSPDLGTPAGFGFEHWVHWDGDAWRVFRTPHNGFSVFTRGSPVLPFLAYLTESIIARADPERISPQMVGPKLLKSLHSLADFTLYPEAGALSPALLSELATTPGRAVARYREAGGPVPAIANLCQSLVSGRGALTHIDALLTHPDRIQWLASP